MMKDRTRVASAFYRALADRDIHALRSLIAPDFRGEVTAGLPAQFGGVYEGRDAMIGLWGRVAQWFDVHPSPEEFLATEDGRMVVRGRYLGETVGWRGPVDAAFMHLLTFRQGTLLGLQQVTDSGRWHDALGPNDDVEVVRGIMQAVADRDLDRVLDAYASSIEIEDAAALPYGGSYRGWQGAIEHAAGYAMTWDPLQLPDDRQLDAQCFGSHGRVTALWRQKATGGDGWRLDLPAVSLFELRAGEVARLQMFHFDTAEVVRFLRAQGSDPGE